MPVATSFNKQSINDSSHNSQYGFKFKFADDSPFSWWLSAGEGRLPPEVERDNVEYKVPDDFILFNYYSSL